MRQSHPAGERLFVDYAGQTVDVIDGATGETLLIPTMSPGHSGIMSLAVPT
jgi:hypothetical protein